LRTSVLNVLRNAQKNAQVPALGCSITQSRMPFSARLFPDFAGILTLPTCGLWFGILQLCMVASASLFALIAPTIKPLMVPIAPNREPVTAPVNPPAIINESLSSVHCGVFAVGLMNRLNGLAWFHIAQFPRCLVSHIFHSQAVSTAKHFVCHVLRRSLNLQQGLIGNFFFIGLRQY